MIKEVLEVADFGAWVLLAFYLLFRFEKILKELTKSNKELHHFLKNGWKK